MQEHQERVQIRVLPFGAVCISAVVSQQEVHSQDDQDEQVRLLTGGTAHTQFVSFRYPTPVR